jgi:hypothetical protein
MIMLERSKVLQKRESINSACLELNVEELAKQAHVMFLWSLRDNYAEELRALARDSCDVDLKKELNMLIEFEKVIMKPYP